MKTRPEKSSKLLHFVGIINRHLLKPIFYVFFMLCVCHPMINNVTKLFILDMIVTAWT